MLSQMLFQMVPFSPMSSQIVTIFLYRQLAIKIFHYFVGHIEPHENGIHPNIFHSACTSHTSMHYADGSYEVQCVLSHQAHEQQNQRIKQIMSPTQHGRIPHQHAFNLISLEDISS